MSLSTLPLCYCTNVHPGRNLGEVEDGLDRYTVPVAERLGRPISAGLWLSRSVVDALAGSRDGVRQFAERLRQRGLSCHTLNAFPFGDFHSVRVKQNVYLPDWTADDRLHYTLACARVLADLLPAGGEGSISTLPLGFKPLATAPDFGRRCLANLRLAATELARLFERTGKRIRLAIEPEPLCVLETTDEALRFFEQLWTDAGDHLSAVREHLGVCYDVCHQAVEFESIADSISRLAAAGVRINKVHLSCALELPQPAKHPEGRSALKRYVEERYLHQTLARLSDGSVTRYADLSGDLVDSPPPELAAAEAWRVHFHVPVDADTLGPLQTTRPQLKQAIAAVRALDYAPHLEVETYTWEVLPGRERPDLVEGLTRELQATLRLLDEAGVHA